MGYQIHYIGSEIQKNEVKTEFKKHNRKTRFWLVASITLLAICVIGRQRWEKILIPGDRNVTKTAFSEMIAVVRTGEPVAEAFAAFCREIIDNAEIQ